MNFIIGDKVKLKRNRAKMQGYVIGIIEEDRELGGNLILPVLPKGSIIVQMDGIESPQTYSTSELVLITK